MFIPGRFTFIVADWGTQTIPLFGSMPRTTVSQSFPRIRTFRSGAFSTASHQSSFGFAPPTVPARKSRIAFVGPSRSSSASSKRTRNRAWSLGFALKPDRNCSPGAALPNRGIRTNRVGVQLKSPPSKPTRNSIDVTSGMGTYSSSPASSLNRVVSRPTLHFCSRGSINYSRKKH
jgi:hypothetical protein